ncbi:uncharacterized protein LOC127913437 [Oncorhynchus keta]|uniref:uncharacterized protein LOC127913437 n=1 Tax=Oncorhynchus keta TaxID=8018 RepID=UPI00227A163F|nr:uncharacterized protein LOC127913437 [Oncorhynchus keta]
MTNNASQGACNSTTLNQAISRISKSVDTLTNQLSCEGGNNQSFPEEKVNVLQQDLRRIMKLALKVFLHLGTNESKSEVLDVFGALNSLNSDNDQNVHFIRLWFNVQLVPLLPHITGDFLSLLSTRDFSCSSYQLEVLKILSPNQKAELILDPSTGALENETLVKNVFISLLDSPREEQLNEFFVTFVEVTKQDEWMSSKP